VTGIRTAWRGIALVLADHTDAPLCQVRRGRGTDFLGILKPLQHWGRLSSPNVFAPIAIVRIGSPVYGADGWQVLPIVCGGHTYPLNSTVYAGRNRNLGQCCRFSQQFTLGIYMQMYRQFCRSLKTSRRKFLTTRCCHSIILSVTKQTQKTVTVSMLRCHVCGYEWLPRITTRPVKCPNQRCQSPYWDRPKVSDSKAAD
jgi:predicted Zn-ribbon and HTH transcriptional regulator